MKKTITFFPTQAAKMLLATLLLTLTAQTAWAAGDIYVGYLDPTAPIGQQRKTVLNPVWVDDNTVEIGTAGETTWYLVSGTITKNTRIEVKGTVNLILKDGCNFTVSKGIHVPSSSALNIYAQSVAKRGSLTADNDALTYYAAIGGNGGEDRDREATSGENAGAITIYGGNITITNGNIGGGDGGNGRAGLDYFDDGSGGYTETPYAGYGGNGGNGNVTIYSGYVWVISGNIGGGKAGTGQDSQEGDSGSDGSNGDGTVNLSWANTSDRIYADNYYGTVTLQKAFYRIEDAYIIDAGVVNNNDLLNGKNLIYAGNSYTVTIGSMPDGVTATADLELSAGVKTAVVGQVVTISFSGVPDGKVPVVSVTYGNNNDNVNDIIDNGDGTFSFVMPNGTVTVTASDLIEKIPYILEDGTTAYCTNYTVLDGTKTSLASGTYVVNSNVTVDGRINLTGDMNLILGDGYTLDVKGIYIPLGSTLTIYAQSDGVTAGKIVSKPTSGAGIGGMTENDNGNIVIYGGIIEATGGENCAAIGGGNGGSGGTITIYGGNITANGPTDSDPCENGAGIGGGNGGSGGIITINGGTITTYSRDGAGIGGGDEGDGGTITITGGEITSTKVNQGQGARIGGGCDAAPGTIIINGGTITTVGGSGAGIGGGKRNPAGGTVTINGGIINASGDYGIGAGEEGANVAIILGWMKATDQIYASSYNGTVSIASGKTLYNGTEGLSGTINSDDFGSKLNGKTLRTYDYRTVSYVKADGTTGSADALPLTGSSTSTVTLGSDGETTWYVVNSDVGYKRIELVGDVHLILCDGKTMTAYGGSASAIIGDYRYSNSLTIYGQSAGTGTLQAMCGEGNGISSNAITINGGTVNAEGGDYFDISAGGNVIINGGNVSATGNSGGIMARGNIILGWTNNTDRITASSFSADGTISIADGKVFTDGSGNYFYGTIADVSTLAGKKLTPVTDAIPYIDADGTTAYCTNYTEINTSNMPTTLSGGWYVVNGTVNYTDQITLNGDVNLILADGCTMDIKNDGSTCIDDENWGGHYSLTIYGQTGQTGTLSAFSSGYDNPTVKLKNYIQYGGTVTINSGGTALCLNNGDFTLTRGTLNVTGSNYSSYYKAIELDNGHAVTVSGGTLNATGGYAIKGNLNMTGGTVNATGSSYGIITGTVTIAEQMIDCTAGTKRAITESIDGNQATALQTFFGNASVSASFKRTFTENVASTICLPFPMTSIPSGKVYQFVGVEYDDTEGWMATMQEADPTAEPPVTGNEATTLAANTPYLFMPAATGPVLFYGTAPASVSAGTTTSGDWTFQGTYSRLTYETTESNSNPFSGKVFGFAASDAGQGVNDVKAGEFVRADDGAFIPAFRAFLKYAGDETSLQARGTRGGETDIPETITVRLIGKSGEIDGIGEIRLSTGEVTFDPNAWYDLNGHRLAEKPTQRGIYINNGRKVAIK